MDDKQKLNDFSRSLKQITGPELESEKGREILECALDSIKHLSILIGEESEGLHE